MENAGAEQANRAERRRRCMRAHSPLRIHRPPAGPSPLASVPAGAFAGREDFGGLEKLANTLGICSHGKLWMGSRCTPPEHSCSAAQPAPPNPAQLHTSKVLKQSTRPDSIM